MEHFVGEALTFDDVLLLPRRSAVLPRDADTRTRLATGLELPVPLLSAAMDTVTEADLATALAQAGGLGVLHKNQEAARQADAVRAVKSTPPAPGAAVDPEGRLLAAAALSALEYDRAARLVEAGVDLLCVDSAHGHAEAVLETVTELRRRFSQPVMAGNVATAEAVLDLAAAGAAVVKVGVGPGSICTTRVVSGVGVPQLTALLWCCEAARAAGVTVVADGGVSHSGDVVKALAAGAAAVMLGRLLAGVDEAPGTRVTVGGRVFKAFRGMGSLGAMAAGSAARYGQRAEDGPAKLVPEGVEGLVPVAGPLQGLVYQIAGGLRAGMGYLGAPTLPDLPARALFVRQTGAGLRESHPHGLASMSAAPNYSGSEAP